MLLPQRQRTGTEPPAEMTPCARAVLSDGRRSDFQTRHKRLAHQATTGRKALSLSKRPGPPTSHLSFLATGGRSLYKVSAISSRFPWIHNSKELSTAVRGQLWCSGGRLRCRKPLRGRLSHRTSSDPAPQAAPNCFQGIHTGRCVWRLSTRLTATVPDDTCPGWGLGAGRRTPARRLRDLDACSSQGSGSPPPARNDSNISQQPELSLPRL